MDDFAEKRKLPRFRVRWPVTLHSLSGTVRGETKNITSTGACIACHALLRVNEPYWMEIAIPKRPVVVRGRVIWSNLVINRSENKVSKKGLSIIRIAAEDRAWLNSAILGDGEKFGISPKGDEKGVPMPPDRRTSWWLLDLHRGLKGGFLSNRNRPGQKAAPHQGNRQLYK